MKKLAPLLLLLCFCLVGYGQGNKKDLCKKWRIDVQALIDDMPPEVKAMMENAPPEQKAMMDENFKKMEKLFIEFFPDGTLNRLAQRKDEIETGTWEFIDGGKAIKTIAGDEEKPTIMDILTMSSEEIVLKERDNEKSQKFRMIPF